MSDKTSTSLQPDFGDYTLDELLDAYRKRSPAKKPSAPASSAGAIAEKSRKRAMETMGQTLLQYQKESQAARPESQPQERDVPAAIGVVPSEPDNKIRENIKKSAFSLMDMPPAANAESEQAPEPEQASKPEPVPESEAKSESEPESVEPPTVEPASETMTRRPRITVGEDGIITLHYGTDESENAPTEPEEPEAPAPQPTKPDPFSLLEEDLPREAVSSDDAEAEEPVRRRPQSRPSPGTQQSKAEKSLSLEKLLTPLVQLMATRLAKKQLQKTEAENWPEPVDIRETPELSPKKAGKFYTAHIKPLRLRARIAFFLCLILAWISFQFPMAGALGQSVALQAGVSLVLTLAVMVTALDVFTAGLRQVLELHPGMEALASLACIISCADAATVMLGYSTNLPYCAVGAFSLTTALWSQRLTCSSLRRTCKTILSSKSPSALSTEPGSDGGPSTLTRTQLQGRGIVRRSEEPDLCQTTYATAAPLLLIAALLLSVLASLGGQGGYFLHTLSALLSVSASFTAFFAFPLPFSIASRHLQSSGVALAGYAGCADIGKTRRVVITDEDMFPPGTMKFSEINVLEGVFVNKVVSYTASLLAASGSGVTGLFNELMTRRSYEMAQVDQFAVREDGGLSGMIGGESVLVGSPAFMNLMGIRPPQNLTAGSAICTAIGGELVGVFTIEYIPVTSVQDALVTLLRGKTQAVFAVRDFNITPQMVAQLFLMPTSNFNFPLYRDRYRMTAPHDPDARLAAIITRNGMLPLVTAAESGRKLYNTCRLNTILALVGTVLGMLIMFLLCRVGAFDTASAGNMLTFMLLWALPAVILSIGQNH